MCRIASAFRGCSANCNCTGLQEREKITIYIHGWRQCRSGFRIRHFPYHGTIYFFNNGIFNYLDRKSDFPNFLNFFEFTII